MAPTDAAFAPLSTEERVVLPVLDVPAYDLIRGPLREAGRAAEPSFPRGPLSRPRARLAVAQASDGPAPTLVVDLTGFDLAPGTPPVVELLVAQRRCGMRADPRLGAKTIGIVACAGADVDLAFLQGMGAAVDPTAAVCVNSAAAAISVARRLWGLVANGPVRVGMGTVRFELSEVA